MNKEHSLVTVAKLGENELIEEVEINLSQITTTIEKEKYMLSIFSDNYISKNTDDIVSKILTPILRLISKRHEIDTRILLISVYLPKDKLDILAGRMLALSESDLFNLIIVIFNRDLGDLLNSLLSYYLHNDKNKLKKRLKEYYKRTKGYNSLSSVKSYSCSAQFQDSQSSNTINNITLMTSTILEKDFSMNINLVVSLSSFKALMFKNKFNPEFNLIVLNSYEIMKSSKNSSPRVIIFLKFLELNEYTSDFILKNVKNTEIPRDMIELIKLKINNVYLFSKIFNFLDDDIIKLLRLQ